ncbi:MAG: hypothetical protein JWP63_1605 [Candidatus Solibacter sp.]|jgi:hypothetical protein|nr:hypothetical protein [Candidatus Solibacter sp.]
MALTKVEREQIHDSKLKLQSVTYALSRVDPEKIQNLSDIQECLEDANKSLSDALRKPQEEQSNKRKPT